MTTPSEHAIGADHQCQLPKSTRKNPIEDWTVVQCTCGRRYVNWSGWQHAHYWLRHLDGPGVWSIFIGYITPRHEYFRMDRPAALDEAKVWARDLLLISGTEVIAWSESGGPTQLHAETRHVTSGLKALARVEMEVIEP